MEIETVNSLEAKMESNTPRELSSEERDRLEFLGDLMVNFFLGCIVLEEVPHASVGNLTTALSYLKSAKHLSQFGYGGEDESDKVRSNRFEVEIGKVAASNGSLGAFTYLEARGLSRSVKDYLTRSGLRTKPLKLLDLKESANGISTISGTESSASQEGGVQSHSKLA